MFGRWDADVIIHSIKYAVLWNGIHHYRPVLGKQALLRSRNCHKQRLQAIYEAGYTSYVIRDMGNYNPKFVEERFDEFIVSLSRDM